MLRGFEQLSSDARPERSGTVQKKSEKEHHGDHINVYEYLKGGSKEEEYNLFSGAQWQSKR